MLDATDSVILNCLLFQEVNYQYECQSRDQIQRPPLCLVLLGHSLESNGAYEITRAIAIPMTLNVEEPQGGEFQYNKPQVERRIQLVREVRSELQVCGIMVVNDHLYDYKDLIKRFVHDFDTKIRYFFTYEPDLDAEMHTKLNGFQFHPSKQRIGYRCDHGKIPIATDECNLEIPQVSDRQHMEQEIAFERRLAAEIDRMINYLDKCEPSDIVLRKMSMLVCQLRRGATEDIEQAIMNKEGEINALRTTCEQWEMAQDNGIK
ncbi:CSI1 (YMR025W) [Zygosaccharomyces parabailii]|nr:CSI1 (YMR025W) [Zygosaccharomyces parabailii]CDH11712.1 uncharacterized protein ZBAI_03498 [Zygosaccharomyces bailii ISA1307]